jgi:hypothetical protein
MKVSIMTETGQLIEHITGENPVVQMYDNGGISGQIEKDNQIIGFFLSKGYVKVITEKQEITGVEVKD